MTAICGHLLDFLSKSDRIKGPFELSLSLVNDNAIKKINKKHRYKNSATDVLSFPLWENIRRALAGEDGRINLGDIVISHNTCRAQALQIGHSVDDEFLRLLVHGLLHLFGYDHEKSKKEEVRMQRREDELLEMLAWRGY